MIYYRCLMGVGVGVSLGVVAMMMGPLKVWRRSMHVARARGHEHGDHCRRTASAAKPVHRRENAAALRIRAYHAGWHWWVRCRADNVGVMRRHVHDGCAGGCGLRNNGGRKWYGADAVLLRGGGTLGRSVAENKVGNSVPDERHDVGVDEVQTNGVTTSSDGVPCRQTIGRFKMWDSLLKTESVDETVPPAARAGRQGRQQRKPLSSHSLVRIPLRAAGWCGPSQSRNVNSTDIQGQDSANNSASSPPPPCRAPNSQITDHRARRSTRIQ
jgi:hypothetical protein